MAHILQCQGCTARFRMHLRQGAPAHAALDCPRCGAPIDLAPFYRDQEPPNPTPTPTPTTSPAPVGWQKIDRSAVFGRPAPPPPTAPTQKPQIAPDARFQDVEPPRLGLFGAPQPQPLRPPRHPEADRPDPVRPLASALLRELRLQRGQTESVDAAPTPQETPTIADASAPSTASEWLSEDLIQDAVDAAADELFFVDDSPLPLERLPGADLNDELSVDGPPAAETVEPPKPSEPPPQPATKPPPLPPSPLQQPAPAPTEPPKESPKEPPAPVVLDLPQKTYRLRIGSKIYANIELDGLLELVRRGIWLIADEISEDDGPWMPLEDHPIYDRVRRLVSDGLTTLLLTHAQLVDEIPHEPQAPKAPLPESTRQALATARIENAPAPPQPIAARPIRAGSSPFLWTYALISTGVAASALTFALISGPTATDPHPNAEAAPALAALATAADDQPPHEPIQPQNIQDAVDFAAFRTAQALHNTDAPALANQALQQGRFQLARQIAATNLGRTDSDHTLQAIFDRAVTEDPLLKEQFFTITPDSHGDVLRVLGGGSSVTLRFTDQGKNLFAFKPNQFEWEDGWRVEVANYQLCKLLPCDFHIPANYSTRISREDFDELYSRLDSPRQHAYAQERFDELIWVKEPGPDGIEREYLYGVLKDWVPGLTTFPIEYTELWQDFFDLSKDEHVLDEPRQDFLRRLRTYQDGRFAKTLAREYQDETMRDFARQLSNLSVIDYLTSDFDRYSGIEDYYGVNTHFLNGQFVALDNGAAFQFRPLIMMEPRRKQVQRFSRTLVNAIRLMRPETTDPVLFPDADAREALRLQVFWEQRDKFLRHVDDLVEKYGEEAVYAFD